MHFPSDTHIHVIGQGLLDRTLPKADWTHAAHLAAAAWLLAVRPDIDAPTQMPDIIRAYNEAVGTANTDTGGYHHTITLASLRAVGDFLSRQPTGTPLHIACEELLKSPYGDKAWLMRYWSPDLLFSKEARLGWIAPDRAPLPF
ncbi:hypothetical protein GTP46_05465 [Duganella sp. FT135W]|uniref:Uncharacterized protein n=1 Tax=Duganella flavida TaxID=2692175 RepID=A0A6L8K879_9BURK|nr:hypothetical protein [Duganella flavida]MYM22092.1 hypothetical protein [Duganella flavida]